MIPFILVNDNWIMVNEVPDGNVHKLYSTYPTAVGFEWKESCIFNDTLIYGGKTKSDNLYHFTSKLTGDSYCMNERKMYEFLETLIVDLTVGTEITGTWTFTSYDTVKYTLVYKG